LNEPIYQLDGVKKIYNERTVLQMDALQVEKGEVLALVGPSGAGKSTFLRLLNFLEPPSQGEIKYKGVVFSPGRTVPIELSRQVTTVFQRPMLLNRSVWENVSYGLKLRGLRDSAQKIKTVLEQVGLEPLSRQPARKLSGGEAQRVALARAMAIEPEVLLLDEPTANLDPYNVGLIETIVSSLNREKGTTLVLVTHNVFQAKRLAGRVALLLDGRTVEIGETEKFFNSPSDPRTAAFVRGEMIY
jgi:tungstate transport system ATP-binding protein